MKCGFKSIYQYCALLFVSTVLLSLVGCQPTYRTSNTIEDTSSSLLKVLLQQSDIPAEGQVYDITTVQKKNAPTTQNHQLLETADRMIAYHTNQEDGVVLIHRLKHYAQDAPSNSAVFAKERTDLGLEEGATFIPEIPSSVPVEIAQCVGKENVFKFCLASVKYNNILSSVSVYDPNGIINDQTIADLLKDVTVAVDKRIQSTVQ